MATRRPGAKSNDRASARKGPTTPWEDKFACLQARWALASSKRDERSWPDYFREEIRRRRSRVDTRTRLHIPDAMLPEIDERERKEAATRQRFARLAEKVVAEADKFREEEGPERYGRLDERTKRFIGDARTVARAPRPGRGGHPLDLARRSALETLELCRFSRPFGAGGAPWWTRGNCRGWKPEALDLGLLSVFSGVDLPTGWRNMSVHDLIDHEVAAMRPYLRSGAWCARLYK